MISDCYKSTPVGSSHTCPYFYKIIQFSIKVIVSILSHICTSYSSYGLSELISYRVRL